MVLIIKLCQNKKDFKMGFNLISTRLASISSKMFCMRIASGSTSPPMAADIDGRTIKDCSVVTNVRVFSLLRLGVSLILKDDQDKEKEENKIEKICL